MRITFEFNEQEIKMAIADYIKKHTGKHVWTNEIYLRMERDDRTECPVFYCTAKSSENKEEEGDNEINGFVF